jgi:hypothetical protein
VWDLLIGFNVIKMWKSVAYNFAGNELSLEGDKMDDRIFDSQANVIWRIQLEQQVINPVSCTQYGKGL